MKALLYKEFKLIVNPMFYTVALLSALILIPQWVYFIALLYFCFTSAPNLFTLSRTYKEIYFSATQPVRRSDIVMARLITMVALEVLQVLVAAVCVVLKLTLWPAPNYFMDANVAFLGLSLVMFGLFNVVMLPMFFRTAYKVLAAALCGTVATLIFAVAVELLVVFVPFVAGTIDGMRTTPAHVITLIAGAAAFAGLNWIAYRVSASRFAKVDL